MALMMGIANSGGLGGGSIIVPGFIYFFDCNA